MGAEKPAPFYVKKIKDPSTHYVRSGCQEVGLFAWDARGMELFAWDTNMWGNGL